MKNTITKTMVAALLLLLVFAPLAYAEDDEGDDGEERSDRHSQEDDDNDDDRRVWDFSDDFDREEESEVRQEVIVEPIIQTDIVLENLSVQDIAPPVVTINTTTKKHNSTLYNSTVFVPSWNETTFVNINPPKEPGVWSRLLNWLGILKR